MSLPWLAGVGPALAVEKDRAAEGERAHPPQCSSCSRHTAGGLVFAPLRTRRAIALREAIKISVRFGQFGARLLFDDLIGAQHYRWRYRKAKRRSGPAVDDHLELGRKLHRKIAGLFARRMRST